uniref:Uncharacterized protein n=1 Tax=Tetranychus urticae TaxID=32264 RepID=T1KL51_TETUR
MFKPKSTAAAVNLNIDSHCQLNTVQPFFGIGSWVKHDVATTAVPSTTTLANFKLIHPNYLLAIANHADTGWLANLIFTGSVDYSSPEYQSDYYDESLNEPTFTPKLTSSSTSSYQGKGRKVLKCRTSDGRQLNDGQCNQKLADKRLTMTSLAGKAINWAEEKWSQGVREWNIDEFPSSSTEKSKPFGARSGRSSDYPSSPSPQGSSSDDDPESTCDQLGVSYSDKGELLAKYEDKYQVLFSPDYNYREAFDKIDVKTKHNLTDGNRTRMKFDRILCDAPCTGDGTIRKNVDVWTKWTISNGNNFHGIQSRIGRRCLESLAKDEEAVVASLLNQCEGGVELVDVSESLPGLKYSPGIDTWVVMQKDMKILNSCQEVEEITEHKSMTDASRIKTDPPAKRARRFRGLREDPFYFFTEESEEWIAIKKFFKISDKFPVNQLFARSKGAKRNIYFVTSSFINAGVRLFCRADDKVCDVGYRITQEGLSSLFPYLDKENMVTLNATELALIITQEMTRYEQLEESTRLKLSTLPSGCIVAIYCENLTSKCPNRGTINHEMVVPLCIWKGKNTVRPFVSKSERIHFLRICGGDTKKLGALKFANLGN